MKLLNYLWVAIIMASLCGCSRTNGTAKTETGSKFEPHPPHGGTPVALGEDYSIELVLDRATGRLQAFVLDGEMEDFIRIPAEAIEIDAQVPGHEEKLELRPVPNPATGEKVGDTCLFETQADWLKTTPTFDAVLKEITVRDNKYSNVKFNFPKGNDEETKK